MNIKMKVLLLIYRAKEVFYGIRKVTMQDLDQIIALENIGFSPEEAATPEALKLRIEQIQETFIVAEKNDEVIGYQWSSHKEERYISDDLFKMSPQIIVKVAILVC